MGSTLLNTVDGRNGGAARKAKPALDAWKITRQFMARDNRWLRNFIIPRYTPLDWWECDIFEVTPARVFVEYEIKLTRTDFFADAKKMRDRVPRAGGGSSGLVLKHDCLRAHDSAGPARFFYIVPAGLIKAAEAPEWAGVIFCWPSPLRPETLTFRMGRKAPRLHHGKVSDGVWEAMRQVCYYRMHNSFAAGQPVYLDWPMPYEGPEGAD